MYVDVPESMAGAKMWGWDGMGWDGMGTSTVKTEVDILSAFSHI
jgi:hypothetical protein